MCLVVLRVAGMITNIHEICASEDREVEEYSLVVLDRDLILLRRKVMEYRQVCIVAVVRDDSINNNNRREKIEHHVLVDLRCKKSYSYRLNRKRKSERLLARVSSCSAILHFRRLNRILEAVNHSVSSIKSGCKLISETSTHDEVSLPSTFFDTIYDTFALSPQTISTYLRANSHSSLLSMTFFFIETFANKTSQQARFPTPTRS